MRSVCEQSNNQRYALIATCFFLMLFSGVPVVAHADCKSLRSGNWSDPSLWSDGIVPRAGECPHIPASQVVTYDVFSDTVLGSIEIEGTLRFTRATSTRLKTSDNIIVMMGGHLDMGTPSDVMPANIRAEVIFVLSQTQADAYVGGPLFQPTDIGLWVMEGGRWDVHGAPHVRTWSKLGSDANAGTSAVMVENDVTDWYIGGTIAISSTRIPTVYRIRSSDLKELSTQYIENELCTIQAIERLEGGKTKIVFAQPLTYSHSGTAPFKGEVGLLTRNVLFKTELLSVSEASIVSDVRTRKFAHTMYMQGSKGNIQYAEFKYMGHYGTKGRYTIHLHQMLETSRGMVVRGNSAWYTGLRHTNLHTTHGVLVEDNVSYSSANTAFFVELDPLVGENSDNVFVHNLAVGTKTEHFGDRNNKAVFGEFWNTADFWPGAHTVNEAFLGNVSAGSDGTKNVGYHFPEIGNMITSSPGTIPFTFVKNEAHSIPTFGVFTWQNAIPSRDMVDTLSWRNGEAGIRWGAYGAPFKYFNSQLLENGKYGIRYTSIESFLQDSVITGATADNSSEDVALLFNLYPYPQRPDPSIWIVRNNFSNFKTAGIYQAHDLAAAGTESWRIPVSDLSSCAYMHQMGNTFENVNKPLEFGRTRNGNAFWRVFDWTGGLGLPSDFVLFRKDQTDPFYQTPIPQKLINSQTFYSPETDSYVTPLSSLSPGVQYTGLAARLEVDRRVPEDYLFDYTLSTEKNYPPTISITVTRNGKLATIRANVTDDKGAITRVEFFVDWMKISTLTTAPYETTVDLSGHPRNYAYLYARAFDGTKMVSAHGGGQPNVLDGPYYEVRAYSNVIELGPEILHANDAPVFTPIPDQTVDEGALLSFTVSAADPNNDPLTYSASNLPQGSSLDANTHTFTWTPGFNQSGVYSVTLTVTDGKDSDLKILLITVKGVPVSILTNAPNPFSPNGDGVKDQTTIKASFNHTVNWTLEIKNSGGTLAKSFSGSGTSTSQAWNGRDDGGVPLPDGTYTYLIKGTDIGGSKASKSRTGTLDTIRPILSNVIDSPDPFFPEFGQTTTISYTLSESSYVTIKIYNQSGTLIKTLLPQSLKPLGSQSVLWDGKNSTGVIVPAGPYTYKIWVKDRAGNKANPYPCSNTVGVVSRLSWHF